MALMTVWEVLAAGLGGGTVTAVVSGVTNRRLIAAQARTHDAATLVKVTEAYDQLIEELREERRDLRDERRALQDELVAAHSDNRALREEVAASRSEIAALRTEVGALKADLRRVLQGDQPLADWLAS
ncbi:hypothetical protein D5S18_22150 [Nocardia panacis]|uniref:DUF2746 domain-containing protein n=1 Tax=Nocardia panacis TaxID=2340916 RepID=A0A3A4K089_9NOCA|nr:hypothetical protein [Nocardia panacis]RJO72979.1 hypothetical protein D5S18_22150 [Nocardia panacis]